MGRHIFYESYDQQLSAFESAFFLTVFFEVCPALLTAEWLQLTQIVVVDKAVWRYQNQRICKKFLWNKACSGKEFSVPTGR